MLENIKIRVRQNPIAYCLASVLYSYTHGLLAAIKMRKFMLIASTYKRAKLNKLVIVYCYFPSHYQNLRGIPELLVNNFNGCDVWVLSNFPQNVYPININSPRIQVWQGVPYHICRLIHADLFLTPMVGLSPCSMPIGARSVHFLVSLAGLDGVYLEHHFDGWDYIFCAGENQISDFKRLAARRNISGTTLIRGGYPKLDDQILSAKRSNIVAGKKTVIYAPTHVYQGNKDLASLIDYGEIIVRSLIEMGMHTIFRPHPASFLHPEDAKVIQSICDIYGGNELFKLDNSKEYFCTYAASSIMVTDLSGTGFTYAFAFGRPVIFFAANADAEIGLQGSHFTDREQIGKVVRNIEDLGTAINEMYESYDEYANRINTYRDSAVFNIEKSRDNFIDNVSYIFKEKPNPNWEVL